MLQKSAFKQSHIRLQLGRDVIAQEVGRDCLWLGVLLTLSFVRIGIEAGGRLGAGHNSSAGL